MTHMITFQAVIFKYEESNIGQFIHRALNRTTWCLNRALVRFRKTWGCDLGIDDNNLK